MQAQVTLGAPVREGTGWAQWLEELVTDRLTPLAAQGVRVEPRPAVTRGGDLLLVTCRFRFEGGRGAAAAELQALCRRELARLLSELIVDRAEPELLRRIVRRQYGYLEETLREQVVHAARRLLDQAPGGAPDAAAPRKARVYARLLEHLEHSDVVHIEGFIRFRLKDYVEELEEAVERAVEDHLMDREYGEFIRLLRYFVELQEPRPEAVHVVCLAGGGFALFDADGGPIPLAAVAEVTVSGLEGVEGDALLSALVSLAPRRVVVHEGVARLTPDTASALRQVFAGRVHCCTGCRICTPTQ